MRTKIDANGTLIDFVAHGEDVYVVFWEGVERMGRGCAGEKKALKGVELFKIIQRVSLLDNSWQSLIDNTCRGEPRPTYMHTCSAYTAFYMYIELV